MMQSMRLSRIFLLIGLFALLAGCGHTRVVRKAAYANRSATAGKQAVHVSQPKYGKTTVVRRGQTVYRIALDSGITPLDLALWNDIPSPYIIYPGQRLKLYPSERRASARRPTGAASAQRPRPQATQAPQSTASSTTASATADADAGDLSWRWPVDGTVVTTFASGDPTRQGIDIAGKEGQPVRAASDGVVVYSGSGLVGYGELVIVKHDDHWLSAYGHNRARLVNEGALVKAGQQIAEMGHSGASRDMLHFEIRHDGKPVNPQQYLPKK